MNLEVKASNYFIVNWGAYLAGQPETLETKTYHGKWSCENDTFTFKYPLEIAKAEYRESNNYPYGVFKGKKAIVFLGSPEREKYFSGYSFWPVDEF